jgi:integrase/recombinase XerD
MLEELERRNYAASTTHAYLRAVDEFARYFNRPPDQLEPDHIRQYQAYLFRERKFQPNTVIQHLGGIRFFYIRTLKQSWSADLTPYPKKVLHLPSILSREEVNSLIESAPHAVSAHSVDGALCYRPPTRRTGPPEDHRY